MPLFPFKPFEAAVDEFLRQAPPGAAPKVIRASVADWRAWQQFSPDRTYGVPLHGVLDIEPVPGAAITSVRGIQSDGEPFEWPPAQEDGQR